MENKRLVLAFVLSAVVLIVWSILVPAPKKPVLPAPGASATKEAARPSPATPATDSAPVPGDGALTSAAVPSTPEPVGATKEAVAPEAPVPAGPVEAVADAQERTERIDTPLYVAEVSNRGGAVVSFKLKTFLDAAKQPLEFVPKHTGYTGRTLLLAGDSALATESRDALFRMEREESPTGVKLALTWRRTDGAGFRRTYSFEKDGYRFGLTAEQLGGKGPVALAIGPGLSNPSAEQLANRFSKPGSPVYLVNESITRKAKTSFEETKPLGAGVTAVGLEDVYFVSMFLPKGQAEATIVPSPVTVKGADGKSVTEPEVTVLLSGAGSVVTDAYFGPLEYGALEKTAPELTNVVNYGYSWLKPLVVPLLFALKWIQSYVGNWGVAIIILTFFVKLLLFPLTHKQLVSMKKISILQPKLEAINQKWSTKIKNDPNARLKKNEEIMALYKKEGANPAGGCLPMIAQFPIFIALYNVFAHAIELRHAPFMLWIQDLSVKDPYYVTPILMTVTMWLQQQLMPAPADPVMKRVQSIMPWMFGFFFKDVPAGLVLYWLIQNILTIIQQLLLDRFTDLGPSSMKKTAEATAKS